MITQSEANAYEVLFTGSLMFDRETMQTAPCGEAGEMECPTAKEPHGEMRDSLAPDFMCVKFRSRKAMI